jgi:transposase
MRVQEQNQEQMSNYYLGGDISKGYCDFILLDHRKRIIEKNFQVDDTLEGHVILSEKIGEFLKAKPQSTIHIGFESTGGYENNWLNLCLKLRKLYNNNNDDDDNDDGVSVKATVKVARLNSLGVSHHHKAGLKRNSTDQISAQDIAEYMIAHPEKVYYNDEDQTLYAEGRSLYRYIEMLTKQKTQLLNLLEKQAYKAAPSLIRYWQEDMPNWLLSVLKRWPTDKCLAIARVREVDDIPYVSKDRARELIKNARLSVASATSPSTEITIKSLAKEIIQKGELIEGLKKELYQLFKCTSSDSDSDLWFISANRWSGAIRLS